MRTLCIGKLYKIKVIVESYVKCAGIAQAAKIVYFKDLNRKINIFLEYNPILIEKYIKGMF